jgi:UTP--glucose-1-phosphate uridylyltransferase
MRIKKAVITAAARGDRLYPVADTIQKAMLPVLDVDGLYKPVIQIIAEEAFESGIEEICIVCAPGDGERYTNAFESLRNNLTKSFHNVDWAKTQAEKINHLLASVTFVEQTEALGYGHAVLCAEKLVNGEPFLLLLGDYIYVSQIAGKRCAAQLIEIAQQENCAVSAVNPTIEHQITRYGTLTGKQLPSHSHLYQIEKLIEKPSLSVAELELQTPGLRIGYYLCFFGMHVLTAEVFALLKELQNKGEVPLRLTPALQELALKEKYLAVEMKGSRYDLSRKHGLLRAQVALGLAGEGKTETLTTLLELIAEASIH